MYYCCALLAFGVGWMSLHALLMCLFGGFVWLRLVCCCCSHAVWSVAFGLLMCLFVLIVGVLYMWHFIYFLFYLDYYFDFTEVGFVWFWGLLAWLLFWFVLCLLGLLDECFARLGLYFV